jgi:hypothetical protein
MNGSESQVIFIVILVACAIGAACYWFCKFCNFMEKREIAAQQCSDEAFQRALNERPEAVAAYVRLRTEVEAVLRQLGRKNVSITFAV